MEVPWIWRFELVFTSYTVHVVVQVFFSLKIFPLSQIMVINLSQTKEVTLKPVNEKEKFEPQPKYNIINYC